MALWTPENLATPPFAWFDAATPASLTTSGATVTSWASRIGSVVLANTTDAKPVLVPDAVNGLPAIDFSVGRLFNRGLNIPANTPIHVFAIGSMMSAKVGDYYRGVCFVTGTDNDAFSGRTPLICLPNQTNTSAGQRTFGYNVFGQSQANTEMDTFHVLEGYSLDGVNTITAADGNPGTMTGNRGPAHANALTSMVVSGAGQGDGLYWPGCFSQILVVLGALSADDLAHIEGYMDWHAGLQAKLPAGHAFKAAAPMAAADGASAGAATTLASMGASGSASLKISGAISSTIAGAGVAGLASVAVSANMAATLDPVVSPAASSAALPSSVAHVAVTVAPVAGDGAARSTITASGQAQLDLATGAGVALLSISALSSPALPPVAAVSASAVAITGRSDGKFGALGSAASAGAQPVTAALSSIDLAAVIAVGGSTVQLRGNLVGTLPTIGAVAAVGAAQLGLVSAAALSFAPLSGQPIARLAIIAQIGLAIGAVAVVASGRAENEPTEPIIISPGRQITLLSTGSRRLALTSTGSRRLTI